eukprot:659459-Pelagomonas_calceolata.AAC.4
MTAGSGSRQDVQSTAVLRVRVPQSQEAAHIKFESSRASMPACAAEQLQKTGSCAEQFQCLLSTIMTHQRLPT